MQLEQKRDKYYDLENLEPIIHDEHEDEKTLKEHNCLTTMTTYPGRTLKCKHGNYTYKIDVLTSQTISTYSKISLILPLRPTIYVQQFEVLMVNVIKFCVLMDALNRASTKARREILEHH